MLFPLPCQCLGFRRYLFRESATPPLTCRLLKMSLFAVTYLRVQYGRVVLPRDRLLQRPEKLFRLIISSSVDHDNGHLREGTQFIASDVNCTSTVAQERDLPAPSSFVGNTLRTSIHGIQRCLSHFHPHEERVAKTRGRGGHESRAAIDRRFKHDFNVVRGKGRGIELCRTLHRQNLLQV